jgi:hypothetical protein
MKRRDEIYQYICDYADEHRGPTPSIREIAIHFERNYTTIYRHIDTLIKENRIDRQDGKIIVKSAQWFPSLPKSQSKPEPETEAGAKVGAKQRQNLN